MTQELTQLLSFVSENGLTAFDSDSLSYMGKRYSQYFDSWFYSWQISKGDCEGYELCVEESEEYTYTEDDTSDEALKETEQAIRKPSGQIIGYINIDTEGKKTAKEFSGRILGYYYPDRDVTTDHTGKIFARGDAASALLFTE